MQIKVEHTKTISTDNIVGSGPTSLIVAEAQLVLVECKPEEAKFWNGGSIFITYDYSHGLVKGIGKYLKPILISLTEKIEVGDWYLDLEDKESINPIYQRNQIEDSVYEHCVKILALPEHFSPEHLQQWVNGSIKDGDKTLVECYEQSNWDSSKYYEIKLNSSNHITLYKVEETSTYTKREQSAFNIGLEYGRALVSDFKNSGRYSWAKWLEQNANSDKTETKLYTVEEVIKILAEREYSETENSVTMQECINISREWFKQNVK